MAATENSSSCAIRSDKTLWCWGSQEYGQLGNGVDQITANPNPTQVMSPVHWKDVVAGNSHFCGINDADNSIWCWGNGANGRLGNNQTLVQTTPVQVSDVGPWQQLEVGERQACAIKSADNSLWCWGEGAWGALGNGLAVDALVPTQVLPGSQWKSVSVAYRHACGIRDNDRAWCWGLGEFNQLGLNSWSSLIVLSPSEVYGLRSFKQVSATEFFSCGIDEGDNLFCWGLLGSYPTSEPRSVLF